MRFEKIVELCDNITARLETVVSTINKNNQSFEQEKKALYVIATNLKKESLDRLNNKINTDIGTLNNKLNKLADDLIGDDVDLRYKGRHIYDFEQVKNKINNIDAIEGKLEFEKNELYATIARLNNLLEQLNKFSFDELNPSWQIHDEEDVLVINNGKEIIKKPVNSSHINVSDVDTKPSDDLLVKVYAEIVMAQNILRVLGDSYKNYIDLASYDMNVDSLADKWISEEEAATEEKNNEVIYENLIKETTDLNKTTFSNIEEEGKNSEPDLTCGSDSFSTAITLGKIAINVTDNQEYLELIRKSPLLNQYLSDGYLRIPFIIDLKECGNIWLNINESKFESDTFNFIHQVILQYLLAFPAGRLNLCLIDVDDRGDFSRYTKLNAINNRLLCDGIIREARSLNDALMNLEKTMHDTKDNKLSFNDCEDFYEYNKLAESNPQSATLLVLLNYPAGLREEENQRLQKILMNGNRSGIFSFIVNNKNCELPLGIHDVDYQQIVRKLSESAVVINKEGSKFTTTSHFDHFYSPDNGISFENVPGVIKLLVEKAKEGLHIVIPLEDMFKNTDKEMVENTIPPVSEVIDIPIGKRGGEIQNLLLDSTGTGSAHAVVIGGTGSGKSNLLHTIITSACYKYSPNDLIIYLVDFKGGVEFKFYEANKDITKQLPHIKLTGLTSEPEDGVSIMYNVQKELHRREDLFRGAAVEDIVQFRKKYPERKLPRMLILIDEVQELFERDDKLGQEAINILSELFKKGRAFGISILWASQNVPRVAGLKDKVLSQIGNKICLRLNNPDDAMDIGIDSKKVRNLSRPEKGLGIISDIRTLTDNVEFRVAYAYNSETRYKSIASINKKWANLTDNNEIREPLFIVGNDDIPLASAPDTKFMNWKCTDASVTKNAYTLNLGQDYITGKPFNISLGLRRSRDNIWLAGSDMGVIRDIIGYALLSVIIDNIISKQSETNIYYVNGEYKDPEDPRDLYYVLPEVFKNDINEVGKTADFIEVLRKLYLLRRERAKDIQQTYSPIYVFVHKLQSYSELIKSSERINVNKPYGDASVSYASRTSDAFAIPAAISQISIEDNLNSLSSYQPASVSTLSTASSVNETITFSEMFRELFSRGSDVGIHFIISVDTPQSIKEFTTEFRECRNKIILKGVSASTLTGLLDTYKGINSLTKDGIAFFYEESELTKFKPYRYSSQENEKWLLDLQKNLQYEANK